MLQSSKKKCPNKSLYPSQFFFLTIQLLIQFIQLMLCNVVSTAFAVDSTVQKSKKHFYHNHHLLTLFYFFALSMEVLGFEPWHLTFESLTFYKFQPNTRPN